MRWSVIAILLALGKSDPLMIGIRLIPFRTRAMLEQGWAPELGAV
jgi:hypothetical protein